MLAKKNMIFFDSTKIIIAEVVIPVKTVIGTP